MQQDDHQIPSPSKSMLLAGMTLVLANRALMRLKLRPPIDGWRRGATLSLTNDAAKFVLSAFNLHALSDLHEPENKTTEEIQTHIAQKLFAFLQTETQFHLNVEHGSQQHRVIRNAGPSFTLRLEPWVSGAVRFIRPDDWSGKSAVPLPPDTSSVFEFVCRIAPSYEVDLWLRINHVATDGVPVQEMLLRLEKSWGISLPVIFPSAEEFAPFTLPRYSPGRSGTVEVQTLVDFGPILSWRKKQNEKLSEPMTLSAAILWWLGKHSAFSQLYMGTTVETPAIYGLGRGVGVVTIRPADYFTRPDGLANYVKTFNRELSLTKQRASGGCKTLDAAAHLPAKMEQAILTHALNQGTKAFGSMGLTILKDAKVFGAPLGDAGHENGFIAIGGVSYPSSDGKKVGWVVVKGPEKKIANYAKIIAEAMDQAGRD